MKLSFTAQDKTRRKIAGILRLTIKEIDNLCKECGYCCPKECPLYSEDGCKDYENRKCRSASGCEPLGKLRKGMTTTIPCTLMDGGNVVSVKNRRKGTVWERTKLWIANKQLSGFPAPDNLPPPEIPDD